MEKKEVWRSIEGYEGSYEVSDFGRVKSFKGKNPRILRRRINKSGYNSVVLHKDGVGKSFRVPQLVACSFLGHEPSKNGLIVNHISGVRDDDCVDNLELVTIRENLSTCYRSNADSFTSIYIGVAWDKRNKNWTAQITIDRVKYHLGSFSIEFDAHLAYQKALKNSDNSEYFKDCNKAPKSKYKYISFDKRRNKWIAMCKVGDKRKHIGQYDTELLAYDAQQAYIKEHNLI